MPSEERVLARCIYCRRSSPQVDASDAHTFPFALGGTTSSDQIVCVPCNGFLNREVENAAIEEFRFFRSLLGIEGRRGGVPGLPAFMRLKGRDVPIVLAADGSPSGPVVDVETRENGMKSYTVYGRADVIQAKADEIIAGRPDSTWSQTRSDAALEAVIDGPALQDVALRRLAAKIAFERFAQLRGANIAADSDFDDIRDFILRGTEAQLCCGITADPLLLGKSFDMPIASHAVAIVFHTSDRIVGGFVMFFGLYLFWVILSRSYRALASVDDLLVERPQHRMAEQPLLRFAPAAVRVPWANYITEYTSDPIAVIRAANYAASIKLQAALKSPARISKTNDVPS